MMSRDGPGDTFDEAVETLATITTEMFTLSPTHLQGVVEGQAAAVSFDEVAQTLVPRLPEVMIALTVVAREVQKLRNQAG